LALTTEAFNECGFDADFTYAMSGADAIHLLNGTGAHAGAVLRAPDLIILDMNLPHRSGLEVLACIKGNPDLAMIPTVILSTSNRLQDVSQAFGLQVDDYLVKPRRWHQLLEIIRPLGRFLSGPAVPTPADLR